MRRVELEVRLEPLALLLGENRVDHPADLRPVHQGELRQGLELPVHPHARMGACAEVEVGAPEVEHPFEQVVDVQLVGCGLAQHPRRVQLRSVVVERHHDVVALGWWASLAALGPSVHGVDDTTQLTPLRHRGHWVPRRDLRAPAHGVDLRRVGHRDDQVTPLGPDRHGEQRAGQVGGQQPVELRRDLRVDEVDESHTDLIGDRSHQVLLAHQS